jgi:hypothetical protein
VADHARSGLIFDSVIWRGEEWIEVAFTEERHRGEGVCKVTTLVVQTRKVAEYYRLFVEALVELTDEIETVLIAPPETITRHD